MFFAYASVLLLVQGSQVLLGIRHFFCNARASTAKHIKHLAAARGLAALFSHIILIAMVRLFVMFPSLVLCFPLNEEGLGVVLE
jgi:hypothetical protein